jgi:hypothetical protein
MTPDDSSRKVHKIPRKIGHPKSVRFGYVFHAVALPIDKKRIRMMQEAIKNSGGDNVIAKDLTPGTN